MLGRIIAKAGFDVKKTKNPYKIQGLLEIPWIRYSIFSEAQPPTNPAAKYLARLIIKINNKIGIFQRMGRLQNHLLGPLQNLMGFGFLLKSDILHSLLGLNLRFTLQKTY